MFQPAEHVSPGGVLHIRYDLSEATCKIVVPPGCTTSWPAPDLVGGLDQQWKCLCLCC